MHYVIYTRVSTDNQAEKEFSSYEAQEEKIKAFVKSQNNWEVFKIYPDPGYTFKNSILPSGIGSGGDKKEKGIFVSISENPSSYS